MQERLRQLEAKVDVLVEIGGAVRPLLPSPTRTSRTLPKGWLRTAPGCPTARMSERPAWTPQLP